MHFPLFQIYLEFSDFQKFFYNFTFSRKISSLSSAKISDEFSPLFPLFQYISPLFRENYSFPPMHVLDASANSYNLVFDVLAINNVNISQKRRFYIHVSHHHVRITDFPKNVYRLTAPE